MFVKPANAGSSVGINKAANEEQLKDAIKIAFSHDTKVVVEKAIVGIEVETAVMGYEDPKVAEPGEIVPCNEFTTMKQNILWNNCFMKILKTFF